MCAYSPAATDLAHWQFPRVCSSFVISQSHRAFFYDFLFFFSSSSLFHFVAIERLDGTCVRSKSLYAISRSHLTWFLIHLSFFFCNMCLHRVYRCCYFVEFILFSIWRILAFANCNCIQKHTNIHTYNQTRKDFVLYRAKERKKNFIITIIFFSSEIVFIRLAFVCQLNLVLGSIHFALFSLSMRAAVMFFFCMFAPLFLLLLSSCGFCVAADVFFF